MFNKRKISMWFHQGELAVNAKDQEQAVYFFKLVIETSIKSGGIQLNECFNALVYLGDVYNEEGCFEEAELLYQMAAGLDHNAKYVLLVNDLFHDDSGYHEDKKLWLKKNMIDYTDIIQSRKKNSWQFLIDEKTIKYKKASLVGVREETNEKNTMDDAFWSYEDSLDTSTF
jgi:tetratricopeptide (TPR) repeat protein